MKTKFLLSSVVILFLLTRLYSIVQIPQSLYWDEASIGYNAYSIAQTGKDEWGEFLPLHFRAFGEFKLPVYIYTTAIFTKLFGLSEVSVRLPAVLFGLGTIVITYLLSKKLFGVYTGLFAGFFLAISPWFFIFTRTGYEATAGVMFYFLAIYLFLFVTKNAWFLPISALSFVLSIYSYNSFRIIAPLTILILLLLRFQDFKSIIKKVAIPITFSFILLMLSTIPIYRLYTLDAGIARFQTVEVAGTSSIVRNYLSHFSLDFLLKGDKNLRSQQAGFGQIYYLDILLIPLGVLYIIGSKSKYRFLPIALVLIALIPASLTKESPHALRSLSAAPMLSVICAAGVAYLKKFFSEKYYIEFATLGIFSLLFANYFLSFLYIFPFQSSRDWQYGYKAIYTDYASDIKVAKKVIVSDKYAQPYIFSLFYLKYDYDPQKFQATVARSSVDQWSFSQVNKFDKFNFGKVNKMSAKDVSGAIIFAAPDDKPKSLKPDGVIRFLDGTVAFLVYKT